MTSSAQEAKPLISVIMACYNQEQFVEEALDGVLSQTYSPLEIAVFDDCSTDTTASLIEDVLDRDRRQPNVRFIRNAQNLTGPVVCNVGLRATTGPLVLITHGDDVMLPEMIETIAKVWLEEHLSLVTVNAVYIDHQSRDLGRSFRNPAQPGDDSFETLARDGSNACCFGPGMAFERELYTTFGWPPSFLKALDIMMPFYAYLKRGARFISKPLVKYRVHRGNSSQSLVAETLDGTAQLIARERIFVGHLAHALLMQDTLLRLKRQLPERYSDLAERIEPLLAVNMREMARKMIDARTILEESGVEMTAPRQSAR